MIVVPDIPPQEPAEIYAEAIAGGVECPLVRTANGDVYSLTNVQGPLETGDKVRLVGEFVRFSFCMQGQTMQVTKLEWVERSNSGMSALPHR
jgi:hypothetical protein